MKKALTLVVLLIAAVAGVLLWLSRGPTACQRQPTPASDTTAKGGAPGPNNTQQPAMKPTPDTAAPGPAGDLGGRMGTSGRTGIVAPQEQAKTQPTKEFCKRDFDNVAARENDIDELVAAGGVIHIFEREARLARPYACAEFYLAHGLPIDAIDPRQDHPHLTGLHYAIKRNDPKMVNFIIDHGADLQKRAGSNDTKPMGYAYYLALQDTRIDRNKVIGILNEALKAQQTEKDDTASPTAPPAP